MSALAAPMSMSMIPNVAPVPPASPPAGQGDDGSGDGFARCLEQAREHEAAADGDGAAQRPGAKTPANAKTDRSTRDRGAAPAAGRADASPKTQVESDAATASTAATVDTAHDEDAAPDLAALLPGWTPQPAAAPAAAIASAASAAVPADDSGLLQASSTVGSPKAPTTPLRADDAVHAMAQAAAAAAVADANGNAAPAALPSSSELQAAASQRHNDTPDLSSAPLSTALPGAPVAASINSPAPALKAAETPAVTAMVPAPIDHPSFAPALATQVRWWANDGTQQAQLLMNPAEMGPVAVKIVLDGREARIDFSADVAATRAAIEAALPVLAAALDDGGLKLAGGGVHDGSAQRQPEWHARGVTHRTATGSAARGDERAASAAAPRGAPGRGIVDLVA